MELWDIHAAYLVHKRGFEPDKARIAVLLWWMGNGDLRPLAAAIWAKEVDPVVFDALAWLIDKGRVKLTPERGGRPRNPAAQIRNLTAALLYENDQGSFVEIAKRFGTSEQTVRQAVTRLRRSNK